MLDIGHAGIGRNANGEVGGCRDRIGADVEPVIETPHDIDETDGIDIKDRRRVGVVAELGWIAGEAKNIFQADRRRAEQVRLDAENVPVAAGVVQYRLDAGVLLNLDAKALGAHARRGAGRVGHIDGVDAELGKQPCAFDFLGAVDALGRDNFNERNETALCDQRTDLGALPER